MKYFVSTMLVLTMLAGILLVGSCGEDKGSSSGGSCNLVSSEGYCVEYTGSGIDFKEGSEICANEGGSHSDNVCPTAELIGKCVRHGGTDNERVWFFYSSHYTKSTGEGACMNLGGTWTDADSTGDDSDTTTDDAATDEEQPDETTDTEQPDTEQPDEGDTLTVAEACNTICARMDELCDDIDVTSCFATCSEELAGSTENELQSTVDCFNNATTCEDTNACREEVNDTEQPDETTDTEQPDEDTAITWTPYAGLEWSSKSELISFSNAESRCSSLGGRLPTIDELRKIIINCPGSTYGGACQASDPDCLDLGCYSSTDCKCDGSAETYSALEDDKETNLWSSSHWTEYNVWAVFFDDATVGTVSTSDPNLSQAVRCVR